MLNKADGIRYSIISFEPLRSLLRERDMTDLQLAKKIGERVAVVRKIQLQTETTPIDVIRKICEVLECQPGDIMKRDELIMYPAKEKGPNG